MRFVQRHDIPTALTVPNSLPLPPSRIIALKEHISTMLVEVCCGSLVWGKKGLKLGFE